MLCYTYIVGMYNTLHVLNGLSVHHQESKTVHKHQTVHNTLHVSDGLSVHHQESKTLHTASGISHTGSVAAC